MEILSLIATIVMNGIDHVARVFGAFFQYFVAKGVHPDALMLMVIGGGLSLMIVLVMMSMKLVRVNAGRNDGAGAGDDAGDDAVLGHLAEIERDMRALKAQYQSGHLPVEAYVAATRNLYDKAHMIKIGR